MYPVLLRIGGFTVSTYGVVVALAAYAGGHVAARGFEERGLSAERAWTILGIGLLGGYAGAKLYYALLTGDIGALLSRAGLVWHGGLVGGGLAVFWYLRREGVALLPAGDALAPGLALGHGLGHLGCFFSGDSYGLPTSVPWGVAFPRGAPPSTAGVLRARFGVTVPATIPDAQVLPVHPTMLYSAAALLLLFAVLWRVRRGRPPGTLLGLYLTLGGAERFLVEFLRAKNDRFLLGFTTAQALALLAVAAGTLLLVTRRKGRQHPAPDRRAVTHSPA